MRGYVLHFFNPLAATVTPAILDTGKDGNAWLKYRLDKDLVDRPVGEDVMPINLELKFNKIQNKKSTFLFVVCGDNFVTLNKGIFKVIGTIAQSSIKQLVQANDVIALLTHVGKGDEDWKGTLILIVMLLAAGYVIYTWGLPALGISL